MSHANTSIDQLIKLVGKTGSDPKLFDVLTSAILKTIPVQKRRKKLMVDINLNKVFKIKRINHTILAKVMSRSDNMYNAKILSIIDGDTKNNVGDTLCISNRELQITGRIVKDK